MVKVTWRKEGGRLRGFPLEDSFGFKIKMDGPAKEAVVGAMEMLEALHCSALVAQKATPGEF